MALNKQQFRKHTTDRIIARFSVLAVILMVVLLAACGGGGEIENQGTTVSPQADNIPTDSANDTHDETDHSQGSIEFTDSNTDVWPPQPTGITNVATITQTITSQNDPIKKQQRKEQTQNTILAESKIQSLIGKNYVWLGEHKAADKSSDDQYRKVEIFSYDSNTLITVAVNKQSGNIIEYQLTAAGNYQPPESRDEASKAISLAKHALRKQGFTEHEQLTGTALLAHPSAAEIAESGTTFYPERKVYVTFGPGRGELPHYRATVNLSRSIVEESGVIE